MHSSIATAEKSVLCLINIRWGNKNTGMMETEYPFV